MTKLYVKSVLPKTISQTEPFDFECTYTTWHSFTIYLQHSRVCWLISLHLHYLQCDCLQCCASWLTCEFPIKLALILDLCEIYTIQFFYSLFLGKFGTPWWVIQHEGGNTQHQTMFNQVLRTICLVRTGFISSIVNLMMVQACLW